MKNIMLNLLLPMLLIAATEALRNDKLRNSKVVRKLMSEEVSNTVADFAAIYAAKKIEYEIIEAEEEGE